MKSDFDLKDRKMNAELVKSFAGIEWRVIQYCIQFIDG